MEKRSNETNWKKLLVLGIASIVFIASYLEHMMRNRKRKKIYFEKQQQPNTCFIHALNMYNQCNKFPHSFVEYKSKILQLEEEISQIKVENGKKPFYGELSVPQDEKLKEDSSDPEFDYDLKGYYEVIYLFLDTWFLFQLNLF